MAKRLLTTLSTDSTGKATYTYTGVGAGNVGFVAEYDERDSNTVYLEDYIPVVDTVDLSSNKISTDTNDDVVFTVIIRDQQEIVLEDTTVTFKDGTTTIGTATTDEYGVASLTKTGLGVGQHEITATAGGVVSDSVKVTIVELKPTSIVLTSITSTVTYGGNILLTAVVKDQFNNLMKNVTVSFIRGASIIGTAVTNNNGKAIFTDSTPNAGDYTYYGRSEEALSDGVNVSVLKAFTSLSINVPALVYGEVFDVTGYLLGPNATPIPNATVSLIWNDGSSHYATATTDANGYVTFHRDAPTSITRYNFTLSYNGDNNYSYAISGIVSVTVGKKSSILNLTLPINNSNVNSYMPIEGTLFEDNGDALTGKSILVKKRDTLLTTLTTDNNGAFTGTVSAGLLDHYPPSQIDFIYEGDEYYNGVSVSRNVGVGEFDAVEVTSDKSVLSYIDNDSCTLTAQLVNLYGEPVPMYGVNVEFIIYDGDDTSIGTYITDNDGKATCTYQSQNKGHIEAWAQIDLGRWGGYTEIEDIYYYDPLTSNKNRYDNTSNCSITYNDDGITVTGTKTADVYTKNTALTLPNKYIAELEVTGMSSPTGYVTDICFEDFFFQSGENGMARKISKSSSNLKKGFGRFSIGDIIRIIRDGDAKTIDLYYNDTLKASFTGINSTGLQQFKTYNGRSISVKDLKIKEVTSS